MRCSTALRSGGITARPARAFSWISTPRSTSRSRLRRRSATRAAQGIRGPRGADGRHHSARATCRCGLSAEVIGTAPVERVDVLHGTRWCKRSAVRRRRSRPARPRAVAGRGVSRPRPRNAVAGQADARGQSHRAVRAGEFPQSRAQGAGDHAGTALAWSSVTTGNLAGIDLWLDERESGTLEHRNQRRVGHGRSCDAR